MVELKNAEVFVDRCVPISENNKAYSENIYNRGSWGINWTGAMFLSSGQTRGNLFFC